MRGPDADLLKSALSAYIRRYLEYRSILTSTSSAESQQTAAEPESAADTNEATSSDSQLQKLELLTRSFELALQSMDTGKGTFKGFILMSALQPLLRLPVSRTSSWNWRLEKGGSLSSLPKIVKRFALLTRRSKESKRPCANASLSTWNF